VIFAALAYSIVANGVPYGLGNASLTIAANSPCAETSVQRAFATYNQAIVAMRERRSAPSWLPLSCRRLGRFRHAYSDRGPSSSGWRCLRMPGRSRKQVPLIAQVRHPESGHNGRCQGQLPT